MKKKYQKPAIQVFIITLEHCITAGSALVSPQSANDVQAEWETESDVNKSFIWE